MRLVVPLVVALVLAPTLVAADSQSSNEPVDALGVTVIRIEGKGVYMSWTPAQGSVMYDVFRGPDFEHMTYMGTTPNLQFTDWNPPDEDTRYQVVSQYPSSLPDDLGGPMRGRCLAVQGTTGFSLTLAHCMPKLPGSVAGIGNVGL